jgi:hypothetical protein
MKAIDRRGLLRGLMIATAATAAGLAFGTRTSQAMPLDARIATPSDALIQKGAGCRCRSTAAPSPSLGLLVEQRRGRRVCGWRWF